MGDDTIEFYYDIQCPFAYLASLKIEAVSARCSARIVWKPVLLGGVYAITNAPQGKDGSATDVMSQQKKINSQRDLVMQFERIGRTLKLPSSHPMKSVDAMRLLISLPEKERAKLTHALFKAYWEDHLDITNRQVLSDIASHHGISFSDAVWTDEKVKENLKKNTEEVAERGSPGVPAFYAKGKLFWGQDRLHFVEKAFRGDAKQDRIIPNPKPQNIVRKVLFFHDFSSPWSYIGSTQVQRVVREVSPDIELIYVPILLGALFREIGAPNVPALAVGPAKQAYNRRDMQDWLQWWGVKLEWPDTFPIRTVLPLRVSIVEPRTVTCIYNAAWQENRNIGDSSILKAVLDSAGFNGEDLIAQAEKEEVKEKLRQNNALAKKVGVHGTPSFLINDVLIWGQDRLNLVADLLAGWRTPSMTKSML